MALNSRGITRGRGSASWKQGPIVIWERRAGWRTGRSCGGTGGWRSVRVRRRWATACEGCSGLRCEVSTAAPRSPWTNACWPQTPSEGSRAALPALRTAVCDTETEERKSERHLFTDTEISLMMLPHYTTQQVQTRLSFFCESTVRASQI